ncbi:MAG TPA: hypothetical protein VMU10_04650 [Desulfomonilia bacterium]|nr:hypothetical protein [Desulfomonilia bacterium]
MRYEKPSPRMLVGMKKAASRILFIMRTRKIYGYNSVLERIFRSFFRSGRKRKNPEALKRRMTIERI